MLQAKGLHGSQTNPTVLPMLSLVELLLVKLKNLPKKVKNGLRKRSDLLKKPPRFMNLLTIWLPRRTNRRRKRRLTTMLFLREKKSMEDPG
jgi:hypothetical protein